MKRYSNDMVVHVWAQQREDDGQSNNGNLYFVNNRLYSYGRHYILGLIDAAGRAWVNSDRYSITTAKHRSYVWRAIGHRITYRIPALTAVAEYIEHMGQGGRFHATAREKVLAYLRAEYTSFHPDGANGGAAALLWAACGKRRSWADEFARLGREAERQAERNRKLAIREGHKRAREAARVPLDEVADRVDYVAADANKWGFERELKQAVGYWRDRHRESPAGPVRVACWQRVKAAQAVADKWLARGPLSEKRAALRKAVVVLREIYRQPAGHPVLHRQERVAIETILRGTVPTGLRERAIARRDWLTADLERAVEAARLKAIEATRKAREDWFAGIGTAGRGWTDGHGGVLLRAVNVERDGAGRIIGGTLETSQEAAVPLTHAIRVFNFVSGRRMMQTAWTSGDGGGKIVEVGHFRVDRVEPDGSFRAGCHRINWPEIERLATSLGLWKGADA